MSERSLAALKEELLALMLADKAAARKAQDGPIQPRRTRGELPLSFAQQRLWFLDQFAPHSAFYNMPAAVRMSGALDVAALRQALNEIVQRHEALRTSFGAINGTPFQIVAPARDLGLPLTDLGALDGPEREAEALRLAQQEAGRPFDLASGPLIRASLIRLDSAQHILLVTVHHIVSDGWSIGVLVGELSALYGAFAMGRPSPLPPLPIQYPDFAAWQREWLSGPVLKQQLAYWTAKLAGAPTLLALPTDRVRPAVQSHRGAVHMFTLSTPCLLGLQGLVQQTQCTMFMALVALFNVLLARHSGQSDICIGTPIANRTRAETEALIGFFANTLVLRNDVDHRASFRALLTQVRDGALGAYAHQDLPFEQLVEVLKPERHTSHSPLFQVMLSLQNTPSAGQPMPGLTLAPLAGARKTSRFDLCLDVTEASDELICSLEYNTDLFDGATIARLAEHLARLADAAVQDPDRPVGALAMLAPDERRQLLHQWNDSAAALSGEPTVHQACAAMAAASPGAVALECDGLLLSYADLDARAALLAQRLREQGVGPETIVGLCVARSFNMVIGMLGILKAGGAYLPLDPAYPPSRLAYMVQDCRPALVLTEQCWLDLLPAEAGVPLCCFDAPWPAASLAPAPARPAQPGNLAYVIYTSGSTGQPKGVGITHLALCNFLSSMQARPGMGRADVLLSVTSLSFDIAALELFLPLVVGGRVVLCDRETAGAPARLRALIERAGATVMQATPSTWRMLLQDGWPASAQPLRVLCGGEALSEELARRLLAQVPAVWNLYGPTETTIWSTLACIGADTGGIVLGDPIGNTQIYLLNDALEPVAYGVAGHLYIGGLGLARGYLQRPALTAEQFIPDPFAARPGARLYRSGDLARRHADGRLDYLGRADTQVKIRGFRIELGEIEAALATLAPVRQTVVRAHPGGPGELRLAAYVVAHDGASNHGAALRTALAALLPDYMVPGHFSFLAHMPLTPNGKIDRQALRLPDELASDVPYVAARSPTEEILVAIWSDVLRHPRIGVRDNFFQLGGHSLLATQIISTLRSTFQIELELRVLFEAPSIDRLAERVDQARQEQAGLAAPRIVALGHSAPAVLSFAQQRLWFLDQFEPDSALYNMPVAIRLRGALDTEALRRTINEIARRHDVLRASFIAVNGQPMQHTAAQLELPLPLVDLTDLPHAEREARASWLAQDEASTPFDLRAGSLIRARLLRMADAEHMILFTLHHIVSDGWSMGVLVKEVAALYDAFARQHSSPLAPLAIQYADFAHWQRQWLSGDVLQRQLDYWQGQLGGAAALLALPTDRPRPSAQTYAGAVYTCQVSAATTAGLYRLSQRAQSTLFMTLAAAFQILLARYTGQTDICIGTPIANRNRSEIENLIGFFVNTLVLRQQVDSALPFIDLVHAVRTTAMAAYAHQDLPFEKLVEVLKPERDPSHSPLFQVMLALQNAPLGALNLAALELEPVSVVPAASKFDLSLDVIEGGDQLLCAYEYNTDLFDASTIARLAGHFSTLLEAVVQAPDSRIADLPMLGQHERAQLLVDWNSSAHPMPQQSLVQLFEAQALATPHAPAVLSDGAQLDYATLNGEANRLARYLRTQGVGPDVLVGLCLGRAPHMIVAVLAVLKAGGAYVPLDPAYPRDRLAYMLADAAPAVLISEASLRALLPAGEIPVFCLDSDAAALGADASNLALPYVPASLAYVIYTSGSSGRPKGVMIEQRQLLNLASAHGAKLKAHACRSVLQFASINFDMSVEEIFPALLAGAQLVLRPADLLGPDAQFLDLIEAHAIDALNLPVAFWHEWVALLDAGQSRLPACVRLLAVGGEKVNAEQYRLWTRHARGHDGWWINAYGPTESTVNASYFELPFGAACPTLDVPIGKPAANTEIYLLDANLDPVAVGVAGELHIGGAGLARGYLLRPGLTADKFIPHPFARTPGARLYKSGDLARYLADGNIEYLGRLDDQVKIRGFRIELGEIEAAIAAVPQVAEVAVLAREDAPGDKRLVAYVVAQLGSQTAALQTEQVERWADSFDRSYAVEHQAPAGKFDIHGWNSSYDRLPIAAAEMQEWVDQTIDAIVALKPCNVLEIGCGSGLLLHRLAPLCQRYCGTDLSQVVIDQLQRQVDADGYSGCDLTLLQLPADQLDGITGPFDTVLINSVAQYFPDLAYLDAVLEGALHALDGDGKIFVGDLRQLGLHDVFHSSIALFQADPGHTLERVRQNAARAVRADPELLIDPGYFFALQKRFPHITQVEILPKLARASNEMSKYRFDVVLTVGTAPRPALNPAWVAWDSLADGLDSVGQLLAATPPALALRDIGRARVEDDLLAAHCLASMDPGASVADLQRRLASLPRRSMEPDDLLALGRRHGYDVQLSAAASDQGTFHAVFAPLRQALDWGTLYAGAPAHRRWTNTPALAQVQCLLQDQIVAHLRQELPSHMIPVYFVVLDKLPLGVTGKIERKALPAPEMSRSDAGFIAPATPTEQALAAIWAELLKLDRVGAEDNFFTMGGHSLMATQVVSKLRTQFQIELPLRALFEAPTVQELAQRIDALRDLDAAGPAGGTMTALPRTGAMPLSFAQQRLWFLDQFDPLSATYNMPSGVRLRGHLDRAALVATINDIVRRHEVLRSAIRVVDGNPEQIIAPRLVLALPLTDLSGLPHAERESRARWLAQDEAQTPFDLAHGPLIRASLLRLADDDHIVLFTLHHIVSDGWSMGVLVHEVATLYGAFAQGMPSPLPDLPLQYADFAHWQQQWLSGPVLAQQADYWRTQLDNAPALLALPLDRPRPPVQTFQGARHPFAMDAATTSALYALSRQAQSTLFMTLTAAFTVLLARYSGQTDICLGTPIANRNRAETEGMIGFFVNTLVLRNQVDPAASFLDLLGQVRASALGAYAHQDLPFEQMVEIIKPRRHVAHSPLFQVMLALNNTPMGDLVLPGLSMAPLALDGVIAKFDLSLDMTEGTDQLLCALEYNIDLFDAATMARMAHHFTTLLAAIVRDAGCALAQLPLMDDAELAQLTGTWNASRDVYPAPRMLHQWFEQQAARTPQAAALEFEGQQLTYAELNARANRLAHHLAGLGVGPEVLVGLHMARSFNQIIGLLAILKAGGAYLPLDPSYPSARIAYLLEDAAPALVLTGRAWRGQLPECAQAIVCVDTEAGPLQAYARTNPAPQGSPANLAYVIYTSGSTGKPKGTLVAHREVQTTLLAALSELDLRSADRFPNLASHAFDISVLELMLPLMRGATCVLLDAERARDMEYLVDQTAGATVFHAVPSLMYAWLAHLGPQQAALRYPHMRYLLVGGEPVPQQLLESIRAHFPHSAIVELYGPTEAAIVSTFYRADAVQAPLYCIGRHFDGAAMYILDAQLNPVPVGVAGQLYIGGTRLARGYLNRPGLTAVSFVPQPFGSAAGARMYASGDLARFMADGNIEYLGRIDHQVKIRGFRIELGEIEAAIAATPQVAEVAVLAREDVPGDKRLVAYLVLRDGTDGQDAAGLRALLASTLPAYMVPSHFVALDALPLTSNGKLDRAALPAPDLQGGGGNYVAPRTATETIVAGIWGDVLGVERIGAEADFFALGGHSLLAIRAVARLRAAFCLEVAVRTLFEASTVAAMAALIDSKNQQFEEIEL